MSLWELEKRLIYPSKKAFGKGLFIQLRRENKFLQIILTPKKNLDFHEVFHEDRQRSWNYKQLDVELHGRT